MPYAHNNHDLARPRPTSPRRGAGDLAPRPTPLGGARSASMADGEHLAPQTGARSEG